MSERSERPLSVAWDWALGCWMLGVLFDPDVVYTGEDGVRRAWDFDFAFPFLMVRVRWSWLVQPYRPGEAIDAAMSSSPPSSPEPDPE